MSLPSCVAVPPSLCPCRYHGFALSLQCHLLALLPQTHHVTFDDDDDDER